MRAFSVACRMKSDDYTATVNAYDIKMSQGVDVWHLHSSLGDADGLLLHGFMDSHLVLDVHLVKLINATYTLKANMT